MRKASKIAMNQNLICEIVIKIQAIELTDHYSDSDPNSKIEFKLIENAEN